MPQLAVDVGGASGSFTLSPSISPSAGIAIALNAFQPPSAPLPSFPPRLAPPGCTVHLSVSLAASRGLWDRSALLALSLSSAVPARRDQVVPPLCSPMLLAWSTRRSRARSLRSACNVLKTLILCGVACSVATWLLRSARLSLDASPVPDAVLFAPEPPPRTPPGSPPPPLPPFPPSPPSVPLIGFVAPWNAESEVGCCDGDGLDLLRSYFVRRSPCQLPTTCVWITARHAMSPLSTCGAPAQNLMGAGEATCRGDCTVDEACLAYEYSEPTEWAEAGGGTTDGYGQKCALFKSAPSGVASSDIVCRCWVKTISK